MTVLAFGRSGQVATELQRQAEVTALGRDSADLTDPEACAKAIHASDATAVINAAAYTAVDNAEDESDLANVINGDAPGAMARACAEKRIPFVHISTDYVFDGGGTRPWNVTDDVAPLGAYGASKLRGEEAVRAAGGTFAILRTSWVFSAHGANFVKTMLRLGAERDRLTIVADQIGGPTAAADIAATCLTIATALQDDASLTGTYHLSGAPDVSWADFAREIFRQSDLSPDVVDIPSSDFPTKAVRPANSRLDCSGLLAAFGIHRPDWRNSLSDVLNDVKGISR